jgi:hypothetical protein
MVWWIVADVSEEHAAVTFILLLMMEAAGACEWLVMIYQATRHHIPEDSAPELYAWQFRAYL